MTKPKSKPGAEAVSSPSRAHARPGPPSKLTDEVRGIILGAISAGAFGNTAAASAGISERTLHEWLSRGRKGDPEFESFAREFDQRGAKLEINLGGALLRKALKDLDVNAARTFLRARFRKNWEPTLRMIHEEANRKHESFLAAAKRTLPAEQFVALLQAYDESGLLPEEHEDESDDERG